MVAASSGSRCAIGAGSVPGVRRSGRRRWKGSRRCGEPGRVPRRIVRWCSGRRPRGRFTAVIVVGGGRTGGGRRGLWRPSPRLGVRTSGEPATRGQAPAIRWRSVTVASSLTSRASTPSRTARKFSSTPRSAWRRTASTTSSTTSPRSWRRLGGGEPGHRGHAALAGVVPAAAFRARPLADDHVGHASLVRLPGPELAVGPVVHAWQAHSAGKLTLPVVICNCGRSDGAAGGRSPNPEPAARHEG